jgi:DNA (cytosine-5)-methyltransferase 1
METLQDMEQARFAGSSAKRPAYADAAGTWPTARSRDGKGGNEERNNPDDRNLADAAEFWQTPGTDSFRGRGGDRKDEPGLDRQAKWATPKATQGMGKYGITDGKKYLKLDGQAEAANWATPKACDGHKPSAGKRTGQDLSHQARAREWYGEDSLEEILCLPPRLNPTFVEWLMGFPRGWSLPFVGTDSAASGTP